MDLERLLDFPFGLTVVIIAAAVGNTFLIYRAWRLRSRLRKAGIRAILLETLFRIQVVVWLTDIVFVGLAVAALIVGVRPTFAGVLLALMIVFYSGLPYYIERQLGRIADGDRA
jgi:hypothetical protein